MLLCFFFGAQELGKSGVPTLEVGDVVEADIWRSKLGGKQVTMKQQTHFCFVLLVVDVGSRSKSRDGRLCFERPRHH